MPENTLLLYLLQVNSGSSSRRSCFPAEARLDGRTFRRFHLDVGAADVVLAPFDMAHANTAAPATHIDM